MSKLKIGDKVKVFNGNHTSTIKKRSGEYWVLTDKDPRHCCNYYFDSELKLVK